MKTIIRSLALALSLSLTIATASMAEDTPRGRATTAAVYKTGIYSTASGQLNIAIDKEAGGFVNIHLKSPNGILLYTQSVGKNELKYRVRLNLSELEDGVYKLVTTNGAETNVRELVISTPQPTTANRVVAVK
jgi:hypothetical protein